MALIRLDGFYLYSVGHDVHPLADFKKGAKYGDWVIPLVIAQGTLEMFLSQSVYRLEACQVAGGKLLAAIKKLTSVQHSDDEEVSLFVAYEINSALTEFEHVLSAEFGVMNIYLVQKVRGYNTTDLVMNGAVLFPDDLLLKVPEAAPDVQAAARCIAFDLPTAAGFHLHRANESVLHVYYDAVSGGKPRPEGRNIGDYLAAMKNYACGDPKILSALKDLKDLHRNPLIHPEHSLQDVDEAIALLGSIQGLIVPMLKAIDVPVIDVTPSAGASVVAP